MRNQCVEQGLGLGVVCDLKSNQKAPKQPSFIRPQLVNELTQELLGLFVHVHDVPSLLGPFERPRKKRAP
jgi:hypothetical protein